MKPPYRVPPMAEIARIKWNGLTVVSTFSGCGGSTLGYRMAGYRVLWVNEFVPIAQESYRANMRRGTILDGRDIKQVTAESILKATGLKAGELDLFDGSPPCQAFSSAGTRDKGWGKNKKYAHGAEQKNEELFSEFVRLRDGLQPRAFVAENVSGLVKGKAKGFFLEILRELKRGYRVEARLLDAQWLGVPQQRVRVIFVGVRDDLGLDPAFPDPLPYRYSVRDALPWINKIVQPSAFGKHRESSAGKTLSGRLREEFLAPTGKRLRKSKPALSTTPAARTRRPRTSPTCWRRRSPPGRTTFARAAAPAATTSRWRRRPTSRASRSARSMTS